MAEEEDDDDGERDLGQDHLPPSQVQSRLVGHPLRGAGITGLR